MHKMKDWKFWKKGKLIHDEAKCDYCGLCYNRCPHKALKVYAKNRKWKISGICMRCERCIRECPKQALRLEKQ